ncbi:MAG TPA: hypothetical protein VIA18_19560 [Polyangia bacterium]|jgi:hypothetical protein|nr:hypothetical protein [Polyangia bacterium]
MSSGIQLKATSFRAYLSVLDKDDLRAAIVARVPPETAALMAAPPLGGSWMDFITMLHITEAMEAVGGMAGVRDLARKGTNEARKPYMGVVETVIKLFGTSPATLFKRMNSLVGSFIRGIDFQYIAKSERSGVMEVTFLPEYPIPMCVFVSQAPSYQALFETCGVNGVIGQPERVNTQKARTALQW